jgi:hypothetical protein
VKAAKYRAVGDANNLPGNKLILFDQFSKIGQRAVRIGGEFHDPGGNAGQQGNFQVIGAKPAENFLFQGSHIQDIPAGMNNIVFVCVES